MSVAFTSIWIVLQFFCITFATPSPAIPPTQAPINSDYFFRFRGFGWENDITRNSNRTGLTFDPCRGPADCQANRECTSITEGTRGLPCNSTALICFCFPSVPLTCMDSSDCENGEVCALSFFAAGPACYSRAAVEAAYWMEEVTTRSTPAPKASNAPTGGHTLDPCKSDEDCEGNRSCVYIIGFLTGPVEFCNGRHPCSCLPQRPARCTVHSDCESAEMCAEVPIAALAACVSKEAEEIPGVTGLRVARDPQGLNLDHCRSSQDCKGDRVCVYIGVKGFDTSCASNRPRPCVCFLRESCFFCGKSTDCDTGETCAELFIASDAICVSEDVEETFTSVEQVAGNESALLCTPTPTTSPEAPSRSPTTSPEAPSRSGSCVDFGALSHLRREDYVFKEHVWSTVLCDRDGSCATDGHIVIFHGKSMMMKTYCEIAECVQRSMYVNSPRYKVGLRIDSKTEGLKFTAFAAKYSTRAEEAVMSIAVRAGL